MNVNRRFASMLFAPMAVMSSVAVMTFASCTPAQRADMAAALPVAEKATCVLLRALTESGGVDEVCATADELAPLVPDLLEARGGETLPDAGAVFAFAMPVPKRRAPRRHCATWVLVDAGAYAR